MNTKLRQTIRNKYDGLCAFCGTSVLKGCHIWDINPIQLVVTEAGKLESINENIENLLPACKSCESIRRRFGNKMTVEEFRKQISRTFQFLRVGGITRNSYGQAIRFGLIKETGEPVVFLFEKIDLQKQRK